MPDGKANEISEVPAIADLKIPSNVASDPLKMHPPSPAPSNQQSLGKEGVDEPARLKLSNMGLSLPEYMHSTYLVSPQEVLQHQYDGNPIVCPNCNSQITSTGVPCQCTYNAAGPTSPRRAQPAQQPDVNAEANAFSSLPGTHGYRRAIHRQLHNLMIHPCLIWFCVLLLAMQVALLAVTIYIVAEGKSEPLWLIVWDAIVIWLFILEIVLRVAGLRADFFKSSWSVLELVLAAASLILWIIDRSTESSITAYLWASLIVRVLAQTIRAGVMLVSMRKRFKVLRAEGLRVTLGDALELPVSPQPSLPVGVRDRALSRGEQAVEGASESDWATGNSAVQLTVLGGPRAIGGDTTLYGDGAAAEDAGVGGAGASRDSLGKAVPAAAESEVDVPHSGELALTLPQERDSQEFKPSVFPEASPLALAALEAGESRPESADYFSETSASPTQPTRSVGTGAVLATAPSTASVSASESTSEPARTDTIASLGLDTRVAPVPRVSTTPMQSPQPQLGRAGSAFFPSRHASVDSRPTDSTTRTRTAIHALLAGSASPLPDEDDAEQQDAVAVGGVGEFSVAAERQREMRARAHSQAYAGLSGYGFALPELTMSASGKPPLRPTPSMAQQASGHGFSGQLSIAGAPAGGIAGEPVTLPRTTSVSYAPGVSYAAGAEPVTFPPTQFGVSSRDERLALGLRKVDSSNTLSALSVGGSEADEASPYPAPITGRSQVLMRREPSGLGLVVSPRAGAEIADRELVENVAADAAVAAPWATGIANASEDGGSIGNGGSDDVAVDIAALNEDIYGDDLYQHDAF